MELRLLRYFLAVARESTITKAAESLHISQPSLSIQLKELEDMLGKQLIVRGKRQITLTEEGRLLRKRAEEILSLVDKTTNELQQDNYELQGDVRIGSGDVASVQYFMERTAEFRQKHPKIHFHFFGGDSTSITDQLDAGLLDFATLIEPVDLTKYDRIPLPLADHWALLLRTDHPLASKESITPADLLPIPLILPRRIGLQQELSSWLHLDIHKLNITATYNLVYYAHPLVKLGVGSAIVFDRLVQDIGHMTEELCLRPLEPSITPQYCLSWKKHQVFSKAAQTVLDALKAARADA